MRQLLHIFSLLIYPLATIGQTKAQNVPLNNDYLYAFELMQSKEENKTLHSSFKPFLFSQVNKQTDSLGTLDVAAKIKLTKTSKLRLNTYPLFDFESGYDGLLKKPITYALAGAGIGAAFGEQWYVQVNGVDGISSAPFFLDTVLKQSQVLPEVGKIGTYKKTATSGVLTGYCSWLSKNKIFSLQAGHDRFFIGDGYRSVLLSDFTNPYYFVKTGATVWRLQYQFWYTVMNHFEARAPENSKVEPKYGAFHYLSYNVNKHISFGVFENVIWRGTDTNLHRSIEPSYLNPMVFFRPQEFAVGSPDNSMLGLNLAIQVVGGFKLYGQLALDEFYLKEIRAHNGWWANKQAWQLGAKWLNAFGWKGMRIQCEYNEVRPYTYSHGIAAQNYAHAGLPLAHPFGANFKEVVLLGNYAKNKWRYSAELLYVRQGYDSTFHTQSPKSFGANIFIPYTQRYAEYGNFTTQGILHTTLQANISLAYRLGKSGQCWVEAGYCQRLVKSSSGYILQNPYFYLNLRSRIWNRYRDY